MIRCRVFAVVPLFFIIAGCQSRSDGLDTCSTDVEPTVAPKLMCVTRVLSTSQGAPAKPAGDETDTAIRNTAADTVLAEKALNDFKDLPIPKRRISLVQAVRRALVESPTIGLAIASKRELAANVKMANAPNLPRLQAQTATGHDVTGIFSRNSGHHYWDPANAAGSWRSDAGLTGSLMLYDFGATAADLDRAVKARDAQTLKTMASIEDVSLATTQAFLAVQQNRDFLRISQDNLKALKNIANLIGLSEQNGNGTKADLQRVNARVLDAQSSLADQDYELKLSIEKLKRLIHAEPGELDIGKTFPTALPPSPGAALNEALVRSPSILAEQASLEAARADSLGIDATGKPRISVEGDATGKNYYGPSKHTDVTYRGMLTLTYPLFDGGLLDAKREAAAARESQAEMRSKATREDIEATIRQLYLQLNAAKTKQDGLVKGLALSAKARDLYREQFAGGKRTLLELLDIQNSFYVAEHNRVANDFERRRAAYSILHSIGRLTASLL